MLMLSLTQLPTLIRAKAYQNSIIRTLVLKAHTSFEQTQILAQLEWHLTTNHKFESRSVPLYILIFNKLNVQH
jgi:hypothetical protein